MRPAPWAPERGIVWTAALSSVLPLAMIAMAFTTGLSMEYFEHLHPADEELRRLLEQGALLRVGFTLDNFFLLSYTTFFLLFALERWERSPKALVVLLLGGALALAALDCVENQHVLAMVAGAAQGTAPSPAEIEFQVVESAAKYQASYLTCVFAGLLFPKETGFERVLAWSIGLLFPVIGVFIYTVGGAPGMLLSLARGVFFVVGFASVAVVYGRRGRPNFEATGKL